MRGLALLLLTLLVQFSVGASLSTVTEEQLEHLVKQHTVVVAHYFLPWCSHCKRVMPEFLKASEDTPSKILFVEIDASSGSKFCTSFPTILIFTDGVSSSNVEYTGEMKAEAIVEFLTKFVSSGQLHRPGSDEEVDHILGQLSPEEVTVVGYFDPSESSERLAFEKVARKLRGSLVFVEVSYDSGKVTPSLEIRSKAGVFEYKGEFAFEPLHHEISKSMYPEVVEMTPALFDKYQRRKLPFVWLFLKSPSDLSEFTPVASQLHGNYSFVWVKGADYEPLMKQLGFKTFQLPQVAVENGDLHYVFKGELKANALKTWLEGVSSNKVSSDIRSEERSKSATVGGLTTLIGATALDQIFKGNILVLFYAPWCGYCQALMPVYKELAKVLESEGVRVAQMDATKNDLPVPRQFEVTGYPSIFYFKSRGQPVAFEGDRTLPGLLKFVNKNAGLSVSVPSKQADNTVEEEEEL
eukprot:TRINITY_DN3024_c6_g1_i1.p1 TRINITY_DN3024_c6_g1~~TRINITY_DN3024_c6_g1_i1.p1  ORF type:complete len:467 (+),score=87.40 TRINITY_DN3024_c6_g1_i1:50-1450(+)